MLYPLSYEGRVSPAPSSIVGDGARGSLPTE